MPFKQYAPYFSPEELDTLTDAFNATWSELHRSGTNLTTEKQIKMMKRKLAQRILVSATAGEVRDFITLKEQALRSLATHKRDDSS